jgi:glucose/arabinose dehydrogenase
MLVTEKPGGCASFTTGNSNPSWSSGLPQVTVHGQGGLMDVALHPRFAENSWVYLSYAARGADGVGTEVARGKLVGERLENVEVIFRQQPKGSTGRHFGSRLVFDRAEFLYITLGDRGENGARAEAGRPRGIRESPAR